MALLCICKVRERMVRRGRSFSFFFFACFFFYFFFFFVFFFFVFVLSFFFFLGDHGAAPPEGIQAGASVSPRRPRRKSRMRRSLAELIVRGEFNCLGRMRRSARRS